MANPTSNGGLRAWRIAVIALAGTTFGFGWNAFSGQGFPLASNVYVKPGDELVDVAEAKTRIDKGALVFDARPVWAWEGAHIPGSRPLPEDEFDKYYPQLEPLLRGSLDVIVYCSGFGCEASHIVARKLKEHGVPAAVLHEGWPAWKEAGYPTKAGKEP